MLVEFTASSLLYYVECYSSTGGGIMNIPQRLASRQALGNPDPQDRALADAEI